MRTDIFILERLYCRNTDIGACFFQYQWYQITIYLTPVFVFLTEAGEIHGLHGSVGDGKEGEFTEDTILLK